LEVQEQQLEEQQLEEQQLEEVLEELLPNRLEVPLIFLFLRGQLPPLLVFSLHLQLLVVQLLHVPVLYFDL
jgi:hypothetical protein